LPIDSDTSIRPKQQDKNKICKNLNLKNNSSIEMLQSQCLKKVMFTLVGINVRNINSQTHQNIERD